MPKPFTPGNIHALCRDELKRFVGCNRYRGGADNSQHEKSDLAELSSGNITRAQYCGAVVTSDDLSAVQREGFWMNDHGVIMPTDSPSTSQELAFFAKIIRLVKSEYYLRTPKSQSMEVWFNGFKAKYAFEFHQCSSMFKSGTCDFNEFIQLRARFAEKVTTPIFIADDGSIISREPTGRQPTVTYIDVSMPALGRGTTDSIEMSAYFKNGTLDIKALKEGYKTRLRLAAELHDGGGDLFFLEPRAFIAGLSFSDKSHAKRCFIDALIEVAKDLDPKPLKVVSEEAEHRASELPPNLKSFRGNSVDEAMNHGCATINMGNPLQPDGNGAPSDGGEKAGEEYLARRTAMLGCELPNYDPIKSRAIIPAVSHTASISASGGGGGISDGSGGGGNHSSRSTSRNWDKITKDNVVDAVKFIYPGIVGHNLKAEKGKTRTFINNVKNIDDVIGFLQYVGIQVQKQGANTISFMPENINQLSEYIKDLEQQLELMHSTTVNDRAQSTSSMDRSLNTVTEDNIIDAVRIICPMLHGPHIKAGKGNTRTFINNVDNIDRIIKSLNDLGVQVQKQGANTISFMPDNVNQLSKVISSSSLSTPQRHAASSDVGTHLTVTITESNIIDAVRIVCPKLNGVHIKAGKGNTRTFINNVDNVDQVVKSLNDLGVQVQKQGTNTISFMPDNVNQLSEIIKNYPSNIQSQDSYDVSKSKSTRL